MSQKSESGNSPEFPTATSEEPLGDRDSGGDSDSGQPARKRQRIRLSCLECRRRKLSCNRMRPCDRCIKSETPERCKYELKGGRVVDATSDAFPIEYRRVDPMTASLYERDERIRKLEQDLALLKKEFLGGRTSFDGASATTMSPMASGEGDGPPPDERREAVPNIALDHEKGELRFVRWKEFRTRFLGPHSAAMALTELTELSPFVKETADELFKAMSLQESKNRKKGEEVREALELRSDPVLEGLLPTKEEANALVTLYLDVCEQLHRIVHIPTFRRDYAQFWAPVEVRRPGARRAAFTALVLAIISISSALYSTPNVKFVGMLSDNHRSAVNWVKAVDDWLMRQSQKHRKLIHFQISCLLYLGKRVNTIKKKRFWTGSGALIQDGISLGLHRSTMHMAGKMSAYNQEMRRRIWATVQELDMQASFDFGLPTALSQLHYDVAAPSNLDDSQFDESSDELPQSKPSLDYTFSSYQHLSRQSLPLRLELSRFLYGPPGQSDYEEVVRYTEALQREISNLPAWDDVTSSSQSPKRPILAYTMLHIQLRQYMLPLHGQYVKLAKANSRYEFSERASYEAARDIISLHNKLYDQGIQALNFVREDLVNNAIKLCSVTLRQPRGTTNMIMINADLTVSMIEKCIAMKEDRLLRSGNYEPWSFVFLYSALGLLEAHLAIKTPAEAKASSVERFKNLQYKFHRTRQTLPGNMRLQNATVGFGPAAMNGPLPAPSPMPNIGVMSPFQQPQQHVSLPPPTGMITSASAPNFMTQDFSNFAVDFSHPMPEQFLGDFFNFNSEAFPFQQ